MIKIHSLETFGTHEGPGIRFVVFTQGCNVKCLYCHNPDTQNLAGGQDYEIKDLIKLIENNKPYFGNLGGLTVSGGEPLVQREELTALFKAAKENSINTTLDTNGSILDEKTKKLLDQTDLVLLDIKHIDNEWHKKITGTDNVVVLKFAEYLEKQKKPFWLRYVLVPGYTDQKKYLQDLGKHFKKYKHIERLEILPYHTFGVHKYKHLNIPYPCKGIKVPTVAQVDRAKKILEKYFKQVIVR